MVRRQTGKVSSFMSVITLICTTRVPNIKPVVTCDNCSLVTAFLCNANPHTHTVAIATLLSPLPLPLPPRAEVVPPGQSGEASLH